MVKLDQCKGRPKGPTKEQILADLSSAGGDDVLFQNISILPSNTLHPDVDMPVVMETDQSTEIILPTGPDDAALEHNYQQVTKLTQLLIKLQQEPKDLQKKYEHLEELEHDVSLSIAELKSTAESVMLKALK